MLNTTQFYNKVSEIVSDQALSFDEKLDSLNELKRIMVKQEIARAYDRLSYINQCQETLRRAEEDL